MSTPLVAMATPADSLRELMALTCREGSVGFDEVASRSRHPHVTSTRRAYARLCRTLPPSLLGYLRPSYPEIARAMGAPNHSSALTFDRHFAKDQRAQDIYRRVLMTLMQIRSDTQADAPVPGEFTNARDAAAVLFVLAGYRPQDLTLLHYRDLTTSRRALAMLFEQATRKSESAATAARVRRARAFIVQEGIQCASRTSASSTSRTAS